MTPEFVASLHPDEGAARAIAFGLVVLAAAEGRGWGVAEAPGPDRLLAELDRLDDANPLFRVGPQRAPFAAERASERAVRDVHAWARAQRLGDEAPIVTYELAALALGAELPPVTLRSLREVRPGTFDTTFETPDGGGYATTFMATFHPAWRGRALVGAATANGTRLGALACALRSGTLVPTGDVVRVTPEAPEPPLPPVDLLLIYGAPAWYGDPAAIRRRIRARDAVLV